MVQKMIKNNITLSALCASVVPRSVQVPENRTRGKKSIRTGPGTAGTSESVLEPETEPAKALGQF